MSQGTIINKYDKNEKVEHLRTEVKDIETD